MKDKIQISLIAANGQAVSLKGMSSEELDSFMQVVSSLKEIVESAVLESELTYAILEGSAAFSLEAHTKVLDPVIKQMGAEFNPS